MLIPHSCEFPIAHLVNTRMIRSMETDITCIYHKDCVDGTTAAAVVLKKFPHAQTFPLAHGYAPEEIETIFDLTNPHAHIYIVDSTLGLEECVARGHRVTVLDHHISVHERTLQFVKENPHCTYLFDNAKSGASLTWSYFFPDIPVPELIAHVEDSDLWLQKYGVDTEHVAHYLSTFRNDPRHVLDLLNESIEAIYARGAIITTYVHAEISKLVLMEPLVLTIGKHAVPAYNITDHQSSCGSTLSTQGDCAVALYTIAGNAVKISFRSKSHQEPSARTLAELLGGGGHHNASGARMPLGEFLNNIRYT